MVCLIPIENSSANVAHPAAQDGEQAVGAVERIDPATAALETPQLRQKLLRLIIEREAQRKLQRSG